MEVGDLAEFEEDVEDNGEDGFAQFWADKEADVNGFSLIRILFLFLVFFWFCPQHTHIHTHTISLSHYLTISLSDSLSLR